MEKTVIAAIGEALIDFIPENKGCPFYEVQGFRPAVGGAPANVCGAVARLGGASRLLTQLGKDPFGEKILRALLREGIDCSRIVLTEQAKTALAFVSLEEDGSRDFSFYRDPSADMLFAPEQLRQEWFEDCFALHFCSVSLGDFPMKEAHKTAIKMAEQNGAVISFDPNLRFPLWPDEKALYRAVWDFLPKADILKLSDEELPFLTGESEIEAALPKLFLGNVKLILFTCGKDGARAFTKTDQAFAPAERVQAVDTTGAGDGFIGCFLWKLLQSGVTKETIASLTGDFLKDALCLANRFCGYSVQRSGAIPSYPTKKDLNL